MNPMIRKELRRRMRERRAWLLPSLYLLVLGGVVVFAYSQVVEGSGFGVTAQKQGAEAGVPIFGTVAYAQMTLLLLLAPIFSAGSLTIEKEQRTLSMLLTSLLSTGQIWAGKFISAMLFLTLLVVASLPLLGLVFAFGGVSGRDFGLAIGMTLLVLASISSLGLYFSSVFRRSVHSTSVSYAAVIALSSITAVVWFFLQTHWETVMARSAAEAPVAAPQSYNIPLYLNPFYALTAPLLHRDQKFPDWMFCAIAFALLGGIAALLAFRNIRRRGEMG